MKKGLSFAIFLIILIQHVDLSRAISWKVDGNYEGCAAVEDCLIGGDWETEFSLDSHTGRMLFDVSQSVTGKSGNNNSPSVKCSQSQGYRSCLPSSNGGPPRQNCGTYTRTC